MRNKNVRPCQGRMVNLLLPWVPCPSALRQRAASRSLHPLCRDVSCAGIGGGWEAPFEWPTVFLGQGWALPYSTLISPLLVPSPPLLSGERPFEGTGGGDRKTGPWNLMGFALMRGLLADSWGGGGERRAKLGWEWGDLAEEAENPVGTWRSGRR